MGWLKEELGEVLQDIGKIERFGFNGVSPDLPENQAVPNHAKLLAELHDLIIAADLAKSWIASLAMAKQNPPLTAAQLAARLTAAHELSPWAQEVCDAVLDRRA